MVKRHEVQVLRKAGHGQREVAVRVGVSERSVRRIEAEDPVRDLNDGAARVRRKIGRPSKVEAFRKWAAEVLEKEPRLATLEVLHRARQAGYDGGKSAFYGMVAEVRPEAPPEPVVRFEGLAGEFSQHDFGQVDVKFTDGTKKRIKFFASRLKYSRTVAVSVVPNERVESLCRSLVDHFHSFEGIPLVSVFDRPKTIALKWTKDGKVTDWNPTFQQVVAELGIGVELCWPHSPWQKGSVENLVGWVKGSFFKVRKFIDEADMREQLAAWHVEVNEQRPSRATNVIPAERLAEERARMRPVPVDPENFVLRFPVQVGPTGRVKFERNQYSMPPASIMLPATLFLGLSSLRIVTGRWKAEHPRLRGRNQKSILPEHRAAMVAHVSGERGRRYLKREHLLELGHDAIEYLTEIRHRRPHLWGSDVDKMHELLELHGDDTMRAAITAALKAKTYGAEYVAHHLGQLELLQYMVFTEVRQ